MLVIDHRDSFTFNLVAYLEDLLGHRPEVVSYDEAITIEYASRFDAIVLSPGPGRVDKPEDIGSTLELITQVDVPMLGVCLGHQAMAYAWGGGTTPAEKPVHGETALINHDESGLFAGLPNPLEVVRYHSLIADPIPECMTVTARTATGTVMAITHKEKPQWGVQFHPESIGGFDGHHLLANFLKLAHKYHQRLQVQVHTVPVEIDTAAAFVQLFSDSQHRFFLDSTDRNHPDGAVSYLGDATGPYAQQLSLSLDDGPVLDRLEVALARYRADCSAVHDLDLGFTLGWVGYLGYELKAECGGNTAYKAPHPDANLMFIDRMIAVDHVNAVTHLLWLSGADEAANDMQLQWVTKTTAALVRLEPVRAEGVGTRETLGTLQAPSKEAYLAMIEKCTQAIIAGDSYEVCLTNQVSASGTIDVVAAYVALRADNPTPFGAFLEFDDITVLSSSPERFLKMTASRQVESRPIKGTRRRGASSAEDATLRADLASNPKDRAENLMVVDLVRNDLTRVALPHTVQADPLFAVESFATVHQLVSTVRAQLRPDCSVIDLIRATFPGGSITGAPKIRTMEIIDELEGQARGVYSGALGYFSLSGAMDLSMVIRTIVADSDGISYGVGGAIVALSDHEEEYREIVTKSRPLLRLVGQEYPT